MSSPFVGEIRMFGGNFAPAGWALCDGQLVPISENDTLFNLIGTTYGGDGQETFALPNLQSRVPVHQGSSLTLGEQTGSESVTLTVNQLPAHSHSLLASTSAATDTSPQGRLPATAQINIYQETAGEPLVSLNGAASLATGGSQPHDNTQPFLCVNFIISLFGIFPSQT